MITLIAKHRDPLLQLCEPYLVTMGLFRHLLRILAHWHSGFERWNVRPHDDRRAFRQASAVFQHDNTVFHAATGDHTAAPDSANPKHYHHVVPAVNKPRPACRQQPPIQERTRRLRTSSREAQRQIGILLYPDKNDTHISGNLVDFSRVPTFKVEDSTV